MPSIEFSIWSDLVQSRLTCWSAVAVGAVDIGSKNTIPSTATDRYHQHMPLCPLRRARLPPTFSYNAFGAIASSSVMRRASTRLPAPSAAIRRAASACKCVA